MKTVKAVYFSPTLTTRKAVCHVALSLASSLGLGFEEVDFTLSTHRVEPLCFSGDDLVVMGTPVYAGRVPNVLLKFLQTMKAEEDCLAIPMVMFGNRNFDDALIELRDLLETAGAKTIAAAAFVGEHSFSTILGAGRPDEEDLKALDGFVSKILDKINRLDSISWKDIPHPVFVEGVEFPYRGYYQPRDRHSNPIDIRKVKSLVDDSRCNNCGICAEICPMGSISKENVREYTGICIKCGACIKRCPCQARYYTDEGYLYHQHELEDMYQRRAEPSMFV